MNAVKTYGADGGKFYDSQEGVERWWRHVIGGAASSRFHRPPTGMGLAERAKASIMAARQLEAVTPFWELEPAQELLSEREENEAYLARKAGETYALYFTKGGSVMLDMSEMDGKTRLRWLNVSTGEWEAARPSLYPKRAAERRASKRRRDGLGSPFSRALNKIPNLTSCLKLGHLNEQILYRWEKRRQPNRHSRASGNPESLQNRPRSQPDLFQL